MLTALYLICAICSLALGVAGLRQLTTAPSLALALILPTVLAHPYDSLVIAMGRFIGAGPLLVALTWPRFLLHVFTLPTLVVAMALLARGAGVRWASHRMALPSAVLLAVTTLIAGVTGELMGLNLAPQRHGDVLFYSHAHPVGPPPGAVMLLAAALVYGGAIGLRARWPWVAMAALYTILVQAVPDTGLRSALVNTGEVLLLGAMLLATRHFAALYLPWCMPTRRQIDEPQECDPATEARL
ncbi:MAG: hypothetical protein WCJ55_17045 [Chloroflexales bacterium]